MRYKSLCIQGVNMPQELNRKDGHSVRWAFLPLEEWFQSLYRAVEHCDLRLRNRRAVPWCPRTHLLPV